MLRNNVLTMVFDDSLVCDAKSMERRFRAIFLSKVFCQSILPIFERNGSVKTAVDSL